MFMLEIKSTNVYLCSFNKTELAECKILDGTHSVMNNGKLFKI
jgi:hypothetical protein